MTRYVKRNGLLVRQSDKRIRLHTYEYWADNGVICCQNHGVDNDFRTLTVWEAERRLVAIQDVVGKTDRQGIERDVQERAVIIKFCQDFREIIDQAKAEQPVLPEVKVDARRVQLSARHRHPFAGDGSQPHRRTRVFKGFRPEAS